MIEVQDAFATADSFRLRRLENGVLQLSFGPTHVCLELDAALDFQFRLAEFLFEAELAGVCAGVGIAGVTDAGRRLELVPRGAP